MEPLLLTMIHTASLRTILTQSSQNISRPRPCNKATVKQTTRHPSNRHSVWVSNQKILPDALY